MDISTANRLYELRKQHGLSQDELAEKLNVSRQAVSKWERSESSPDTDNLIALAKLYGISLDELLNYTPQKSDENFTQNADAQDGTVEDNERFDNQDGGKFTYEENGERAHIDENGAFTYSGDGEHVHIDENGIHVHDKDGSNVVIKGGIAKLVNKIVGNIHVDNNGNAANNGGETTGMNNGNSDNDKAKNSDSVHIENGHISFSNKRTKNIAVWSGAISGATFLLCTVAYILIGCLCNLWHPGWILFFVPMIVGGIFDCIAKKNPLAFPIIFIVVAVYLLLGCGWGMWSPYWAIFALIPAYYAIATPIKRAVKNKNRGIEININKSDEDDDDFDDDDDDDND